MTSRGVTSRKRAAFPAGKTFGDWDEQAWVRNKEDLGIGWSTPPRAGRELKPSSFGIRRDHAQTLATATVDLLSRHAHVVVTQSDGFRLAQATSGQGMRP